MMLVHRCFQFDNNEGTVGAIVADPCALKDSKYNSVHSFFWMNRRESLRQAGNFSAVHLVPWLGKQRSIFSCILRKLKTVKLDQLSRLLVAFEKCEVPAATARRKLYYSLVLERCWCTRALVEETGVHYKREEKSAFVKQPEKKHHFFENVCFSYKRCMFSSSHDCDWQLNYPDLSSLLAETIVATLTAFFVAVITNFWKRRLWKRVQRV